MSIRLTVWRRELTCPRSQLLLDPQPEPLRGGPRQGPTCLLSAVQTLPLPPLLQATPPRPQQRAQQLLFLPRPGTLARSPSR